MFYIQLKFVTLVLHNPNILREMKLTDENPSGLTPLELVIIQAATIRHERY